MIVTLGALTESDRTNTDVWTKKRNISMRCGSGVLNLGARLSRYHRAGCFTLVRSKWAKCSSLLECGRISALRTLRLSQQCRHIRTRLLKGDVGPI